MEISIVYILHSRTYSLAQFIRALDRNRRAVGSIPARGPIYIVSIDLQLNQPVYN